MTTLRFLGGVGTIGSTCVLVEHDGWRVLLDVGITNPPGGGLLRHPSQARPGRLLADRLGSGMAPRVEHLWSRDALVGLDLAGGGDGRTLVVVSHAHLDHAGLVGWVAEDVPIVCSPGTATVLRAMRRAGMLDGPRTELQVLSAGEAMTLGPFEVLLHEVDHNVPGASGVELRTPEGVLAYTGDLRAHGRHPERTWAFADSVGGAEVLVAEGTTLGGTPALVRREELAVDEAFAAALSVPGLVLLSCYPLDLERAAAFATIATSGGRRLLWSPRSATLLRELGLAGVEAWADRVAEEVGGSPGSFVVQLEPAELAHLVDLPVGPGSLFVHADGEPLGPFQPSWALLTEWLESREVPLRRIGCSGHLMPDDLGELVERIAPATLYPVHTSDPYRLCPPPGTRRVIPAYGRSYRLGDGPSRRTGQVGGARSTLAAGTEPTSVADDEPAQAGLRGRRVVCFDLDSTICDTRHRQHMILPGERRGETDWVAYSLACSDDAPVPGVVGLARLLSANHRIVLVSSRDERARELSERWLARHGVPYDELLLGGADGSPSDLVELKLHHLRGLAEAGAKVELLVDDLRSVAGPAAELGVPVLTVAAPGDPSGA